MGAALAAAGISIEGGGAWMVAGEVVAHYLFEDGAGARPRTGIAGIEVRQESGVVVLRLDQETPGQLGKLARAPGRRQCEYPGAIQATTTIGWSWWWTSPKWGT